MLLVKKNAVIYGGGGSLGSAIAQALANEGARVFVVGRTMESVQRTADGITGSGGLAEAGQVDALDEVQVKDHLDDVIRRFGTIDISFCAIDLNPVQGLPLVDLKTEDFVRPVMLATRSLFVTATAAARIMKQQRSGLILTLTATSSSITYPYTGGFAPAGAVIELVTKNLASELGVYGIRAVNIRSGGSPDSRVFKDVIASNPELMKNVLQGMEDDTMLKRLPLMKDIAQVAVFLCSDHARQITGVSIDVTAGSTSGLNYRVAREGNWPREY
ncbi:SDR family oxidoreductase [Chryseolinea sp. T2]|uniref:SDR family NAD(P)-dependent oxidoreductase n=1 Tax=Chryseolinea sp. T2 TaxID=3129255 RepID=UPI003077CB43